MSPEVLKSLAISATNQYLKDHVPLSDAIQKIASKQGLNTHQVARVCEMANLETHKALWKSEPDKTKVAFPVADPAKIAAAAPPTALRGEYLDDAAPASGRGPSMAELFGVPDVGGHNGLSDTTDKQKVTIIIEKTAAVRRETTDELIKLSMQHESEEKNLMRMVKQAYLGGGIKLPQLYAAACQAGLGDVAKEYFPKLAAELHKELARGELTKLSWAAPEDLYDEDLPVTVVNGAQPVLMSLDTLKQYRDQNQEFTGRLSRIDDQNTILSQRLRELQK